MNPRPERDKSDMTNHTQPWLSNEQQVRACIEMLSDWGRVRR